MDIRCMEAQVGIREDVTRKQNDIVEREGLIDGKERGSLSCLGTIRIPAASRTLPLLADSPFRPSR